MFKYRLELVKHLMQIMHIRGGVGPMERIFSYGHIT